jgi:hypothetical protein
MGFVQSLRSRLLVDRKLHEIFCSRDRNQITHHMLCHTSRSGIREFIDRRGNVGAKRTANLASGAEARHRATESEGVVGPRPISKFSRAARSLTMSDPLTRRIASCTHVQRFCDARFWTIEVSTSFPINLFHFSALPGFCAQYFLRGKE